MGCEKNPGEIFLFSILTFTLLFSMSALAVEMVCIDITPITTFHDGDAIETLAIGGGMSDTTTKLSVPMGLDVYSASLDITGETVTNESAMDMVILSDISASMNDNMDDMKADAEDLIDDVLDNIYNRAGLVSFEAGVVDSVTPTKDKQSLLDVIGDLESGGQTCIACAIKEGVELLEDSGSPQRVMVILTNGEANMCTYGLCPDPVNHTIEMAQWAWQDYGIKIYAIPYSLDSDLETLQNITDAANGTLYPYNTSMEDVYSDIEELFTGSSSGVIVDVGSDGVNEFLGEGTFNFTTELAGLLTCECDDCEVSGDECLIDVKVSSATTGAVVLDNLMITGCVNQTTECAPEETRPCPNQEGVCEGSYETCSAEGFWLGCDYSSMEDYEDPEETCDFMDNDCDETTDEDVKNTYYFDNDNDGYGNEGNTIEACYPPEGYINDNNDCNDNDPNIYPEAEEVCWDDKDNDCDGSIDENCGGGGGPGINRGGSDSTPDYCGNDYCGDEEDCVNCSRDCGLCCTENWECTEWSECSEDELKTRTCEDANECDTTLIKPSEKRWCEYMGGQEVEVTPISELACGNDECEENENCESCPEDCGECAAEGTGDGLTGFFTGLPGAGLLGLAALALILLLLLFTKRRGKGKGKYDFTKK